MSARQLVHTHNDYFSSLSSELCTKVNKDIIIRDNSQWYDASIVNLRRQSMRAECRWDRVRMESSRCQYVSAQSVVVSTTSQRERNGMEHVIRAKGPALGPVRSFSMDRRKRKKK